MTTRPTTTSRSARRARLHHVRAAEPVHLQGPLPHPAAQGQPAREDALLGHRAAAPADHRLAEDAAARRPASGSPSTASATAASRPCGIPPLVKNYCLSICSADFNEWVWKNASTRSPVQLRLDQRVRDLRVRPGQHVQLRRDGRPDRPAAVHGRARPLRRRRPRRDASRYEFAKVRFLYEAKLGTRRPLRDRLFVGPHTINGKGTFDFLHNHLRWPPP